MRLEEVIGQNIRAAREKNGWTQQQLGEHLEGELRGAWAPQQVSEAERGLRSFAAVEMIALAGALGTTIRVLYESRGPAEAIELWSEASITSKDLTERVEGPRQWRTAVDVANRRARLAQLIKPQLLDAVDQASEAAIDMAVDEGLV